MTQVSPEATKPQHGIAEWSPGYVPKDILEDFSNDLEYYFDRLESAAFDPVWDQRDTLRPWEGGAVETADEVGIFLVHINELYEVYGPEESQGAISAPGELFSSVHAEVGDDHIAYLKYPVEFIAELHAATRYFGIEISKEDTFVSESYGNYSEAYILKPQNWGELWVSPSLLRGKDLPFIDTAKIRTILPVTSMNQRFSDTIEGKTSLLSRTRLWSTPLTTQQLEMAGSIQAVCLGLRKAQKFQYLPTFLGGLGIPPIGGVSVRNFQRGVVQYKGGRYLRLITAVTNSVNEVMNGNLEHFPFLQYIDAVKQRWQTWYTHFSQHVPAVSGQVPERALPYIAGMYGSNPIRNNAANRLVNLGALCTEVDVITHHMAGEISRALLGSENTKQLLDRLEGIQKEYRSSSIFSESFTKTIRTTAIYATLDREWQWEGVERTMATAYYGSYQFKESLFKGTLFKSEVLSEIYSTGPLRVPLQIGPGRFPGPFKIQRHLPDALEKPVDELFNWYISGGEHDPPRLLLDDDPVIIDKFTRDVDSVKQPATILVARLVSRDKKLAARMNEITNYTVPVVMTEIGHEADHEFNSMIRALRRDTGNQPVKVLTYYDTGALVAQAAKRFTPSDRQREIDFGVHGVGKTTTEPLWRRLKVKFSRPREPTKTFDASQKMAVGPGRRFWRRGVRLDTERTGVQPLLFDQRTGSFTSGEMEDDLLSYPLIDLAPDSIESDQPMT